jgi:uncharacterized membrane protein YidH (DUF202 family)
MPKKENVLEHLAQKRTELAQERTILAYLRTATALILFGIVFIGFQEQARILFYSGRIAIFLGIIFIVIALMRAWKHQREIQKIRAFKISWRRSKK